MKRIFIPAIFVLGAVAGCGVNTGAGASPLDVQSWKYGTLTVDGCARDNGMLVQPGPEVTIKNTSAKVVSLSAGLGNDPATLWALADGVGYPNVTLQPGESEQYTIGDASAFTLPDDPCSLPIQILTDS